VRDSGGAVHGRRAAGSLRVLQVTGIPITALRFVVPLGRALAEAGDEVEFATGPGSGLEALEAEGYTVHRLPISRRVYTWRNLHALGALRTLIRARRVDVVHAHTPAAAILTRLAARGPGVSVVYTMHGSFWEPAVPGWQRAVFTRTERWLGRWTDLIFTVNAEDAADCVAQARVPAERVRVLPAGGAGVAPEFLLDGESAALLRQRVRERLRLTVGARVIAYFGRTAAAKGMGMLARAFARVAAEEARARLLVVGGALEGERGAYSRVRFLRELGSPGRAAVVWRGFQDRVAPLVAASDIVVLPSRREGFGMSLAEAATLGRPAVATDTRGARSVVEPEVTGILVPVNDAQALADALLRLVRSPELAGRMGAAAQRRARERFTREAVLAAYLEGYSVLRPTGSPSAAAP
jgi:glycosyltransferase involved in cell wall biosynthesis